MVRSNSARDFVNALHRLTKKHKGLVIQMVVTPDVELDYDPITFEPTHKTYTVYGATLGKEQHE